MRDGTTNARAIVSSIPISYGVLLDPCEWREAIEGVTSSVDSPERRLQIEVLNRAICDLAPRRLVATKAWERDDALQWVQSDDPHPFSFLTICQALGYDHEVVRERLLAMAAGEVPMPRKGSRHAESYSRAEVALAFVNKRGRPDFRSSRRAAA